MIVVTGTKRSGTSMWMQILEAGGVETIGEKFPLDWGTRLRELNPNGFYESRLRRGVNFTTNPDPETGHYLSPHECTDTAIKIFVPGLVRTDLAFISCVIATMRHWRSYVVSRNRLEEVDMQPEIPEDVRFATGYNVPAHLEWWLENYALLRDAMTRGYPFTIFSYESIVEGQFDLVDATLEWLGCGDFEAGRSVVEVRAPRVPEDVDVELPDDHQAVFDEFYRRVHEGDAVDEAFLEQLDATHEALLPELSNHIHETQAAALRLHRRAVDQDPLQLRKTRGLREEPERSKSDG